MSKQVCCVCLLLPFKNAVFLVFFYCQRLGYFVAKILLIFELTILAEAEVSLNACNYKLIYLFIKACSMASVVRDIEKFLKRLFSSL